MASPSHKRSAPPKFKPRNPKKLTKQALAKLAEVLVPPPVAEDPSKAYKDKPVLKDDGKPSRLSYPTQEMTHGSYDRELARNARLHSYRWYLRFLDLDDLKFALAQNDSEKAISFLSSLMDPLNKEVPIEEIALFHRISLGDLMQLWRNSRLTLALGRMFDGAPDAVADVVQDARSRKVCCNRCDGGGQIQVRREEGSSWIQCPNCAGEGTIRKTGDHKSREYLFKSTGILKPDPKLLVTVNTQASTVESVLDELDEINSAPALIPTTCTVEEEPKPNDESCV